MAIVGTAYVSVKVLSKDLSDSIKKSVEKSMKDIGPSIDKAGQDIGKGMGESIDKGMTESDKKLKDHGDKTGESISESITDSFTRKIDRDFEFPDIWAKKSKDVKGWFNKGGDESADSFSSGMREHFDKLVPDKLLGKLVKPGLIAMIGPAAISAGMTLISAGLGGVAGALQLVGQAAGGAGVAMAGMGAAMATAGIAGFMIFKTESPILDEFKKKIGGLSDAWNDVGKVVQASALPQIGNAIESLSKAALPAIKDNLIEVGKAIGGVADQFKTLFESESFADRLKESTAFAAPVVTQLGGALKNVVDMVLTLVSATGGVTTKFADWIGKVSEAINNFITMKKETGELESTFNRWGDVTARVGGVLKDLGLALYDMFSRAGPLAEQLLTWMEQGAEKMLNWASSVSGENAMDKIFANAVPVLKELGGLIGDIAKLLGKGLMGDPTNTVDFIHTIRTDLLPALATMFGTLSENGPALIDLFKSIAGVIQSLADSGALGAITRAFQLLGGAVSLLLQIPFLGTIVSWAGTGAIFVKGTNVMVDRFKTLKDGFNDFKETAGKAYDKLKEWGVVDKVKDGLKAVGDGIKNAATKIKEFNLMSKAAAAWAAFQRGLQAVAITAKFFAIQFVEAGVAMLASPITWIVLAIAALVAAFIWAWNNIDGFKEFFIAMWEKIKAAAAVFFDWIKIAWDFIVQAFKAALDFLLGAFSTIWDAIKAVVSAVFDAIKAAFEFVFNFIKAYIETLVAIWSAVFNAIQAVVEFVWNAIKAAFDIIWNAIKAALDVLKTIFTTIFNAIKAVVEAVWNGIKAAWDILFNAIKTAVNIWKDIFTTVFNAIKTVVTAVWNGIKAAWDVIYNAISAAVNVLKGVFTTVFNAIKGVVEGVWNGIKSAFDTVVSGIKSAINGVKSVFETVFNWIKGFVQGIWDGIKRGIDTVANGIKSVVNGIIGGVNTFISGINGMTGLVSKIPGVPDIPHVPSIPRIASGGVINPSQFGTLAQIAEAGKPERVEPLDPSGLSRRDHALIDKLGGSGSTEVRVFIGNQEITEIVRVEVQRSDKQTAMAVAGGARWP